MVRATTRRWARAGQAGSPTRNSASTSELSAIRMSPAKASLTRRAGHPDGCTGEGGLTPTPGSPTRRRSCSGAGRAARRKLRCRSNRRRHLAGRWVHRKTFLTPSHQPAWAVSPIPEPGLEIRLVVPPGQPVHPGSGVPLEREERLPEQIDADVVEERGEPFLLPLSCRLPYALQRLGHACPVLRPARALLARVPLGPRPWLHRLRRRLPGLVRRLRCYYGGV
jgi:hypothetical protein